MPIHRWSVNHFHMVACATAFQQHVLPVQPAIATTRDYAARHGDHNAALRLSLFPHVPHTCAIAHIPAKQGNLDYPRLPATTHFRIALLGGRR